MNIFLKLIRWPNVLMTLFTQVVVYFALVVPSNLLLALEHWQFIFLITSTALLTASGNVINDIYDIPIDKVNKPDQVIVGQFISEKKAFRIYMILTVVAVVLGFIVANSVDKPILSSIFIVVSFALYSYASSLKSILLVGNLLISILVGLVVLIVGIFELFPVSAMHTQQQLASVNIIILYFSLGAFILNLIREWIKDCEDVNGDRIGGRNTIALALGRQRASRMISLIIGSLVILMGYAAITWFAPYEIALYYWIFLIMAPLMIVGIQLWNAECVSKFHKLSFIMKLIMFTGILFMFFYNADTINSIF
ncbi:MAG: geranylgeranylglycerol-phosphate geranylgeranyltransferase [Nonlabens sp.]